MEQSDWSVCYNHGISMMLHVWSYFIMQGWKGSIRWWTALWWYWSKPLYWGVEVRELKFRNLLAIQNGQVSAWLMTSTYTCMQVYFRGCKVVLPPLPPSPLSLGFGNWFSLYSIWGSPPLDLYSSPLKICPFSFSPSWANPEVNPDTCLYWHSIIICTMVCRM